MNAPEAIFDLGHIHILQGAPPASGFICERCFGYWPTVDAALAVPCKAAA